MDDVRLPPPPPVLLLPLKTGGLGMVPLPLLEPPRFQSEDDPLFPPLM